ncbi:Abi-domain-containing protein [Basidiobolus meristosporus CBS 931.73]|uniref:intramembrane prenyl-peptidase Rce1 n=1 Tax=Basidiobolus meristosporus CBS 931.73 TaxID=1314790 RepID=A0A1Y1Z3R8_9FUNG|nr:Abi-domain-containing protein [Basidiobolus meristosporus CBS 931.73]|eukprot:ORY04903.1 Abi-domain-containing protein [Basidiobolus meristosporus CBS 931.73]
MVDGHLPLLSNTEAVLSCLFFVAVFVGGFYVKSPVSHSANFSKNDPRVIIHRIKCVLVACIVSPLYLYMLLSYKGYFNQKNSFLELLNILGLSYRSAITSIVSSLLIVAALFLGPLVLAALDQELPFQSQFNFTADVLETVTSLSGFRNFIFGPIAEEFIFRSCMVPVYHFAGFSPSITVLCLPLYFGAAHIHHAIAVYYKTRSLRGALIGAGICQLNAFQFFYCTVFGMLATFLFSRTSSIYGPVASHTFCNIMGFPDLSGPKRYPKHRTLLWISLIGGVFLFSLILYPLTSPQWFSSMYWAE